MTAIVVTQSETIASVSESGPAKVKITVTDITEGVELGVAVGTSLTVIEGGTLTQGGGPGGPSAETYNVVSISSWSHAHSFAYPPEVRLIRGGEEVEAGIEYPDATHVYIEFPTPFTGTIILS